MDANIINSLATYSIELGSLAAIIAIGFGIKHMLPFTRQKAALTQPTESLTHQVSRDFVNFTVQTAEISDSKLFFSSGARKPKLDNDSKQVQLEKTPIKNNEPRDIEEEMKMIAQQSKEADKLANEVINENSEESKDFWNEFSDMITQSKSKEAGENNTNPLSVNTTPQCVWVSWSSVNNDKMQLSNEVFTLQNKWGSIAAMEELRALINDREIINSWAILSVFPIK